MKDNDTTLGGYTAHLDSGFVAIGSCSLCGGAVTLPKEAWDEVVRVLEELPDVERYDWGPSWELECERRAKLATNIRVQTTNRTNEVSQEKK